MFSYSPLAVYNERGRSTSKTEKPFSIDERRAN
jgi:hypothetical protein